MDTLEKLGIGGIVIFLVILVLREVKAFIGKRNGSQANVAGQQSTEFWQREMQTITEKTLSYALAPFLSSQTEILRQIQTTQAESRDFLKELLFIAREGKGK